MDFYKTGPTELISSNFFPMVSMREDRFDMKWELTTDPPPPTCFPPLVATEAEKTKKTPPSFDHVTVFDGLARSTLDWLVLEEWGGVGKIGTKIEKNKWDFNRNLKNKHIFSSAETKWELIHHQNNLFLDDKKPFKNIFS